MSTPRSTPPVFGRRSATPSTSPNTTTGGTDASPSGGHRYTSLSSLMRSGSPTSPTRSTFSGGGTGDAGSSNGNGNGNGNGRGNESIGSGRGNGRDGRDKGKARQMSSGFERTDGHARRPTFALPRRDKKEGARLSLWRLIALTVAMGGSQIAWTVELAYGTPYLLDLGLKEQLTSLVWLAGPISGLVVQPLIGAISDSSTSRFRRRFWIVVSTALIVLSMLGLAFTEPVARAVVDVIGGGEGDWDPRSAALVKRTSIIIAVFCFYFLDFALNGLQASLRNLVFDVTPVEQVNSANAWNARFNHIGNIVGFFLGSLHLNQIPIIRLLGGEQFRQLCVVAVVFLVITVWITCFTVDEDERPTLFGERERRSKLRDMLHTIHEAVLNLPKPVRRICMVQIAAFMGWFPFLFYATTYVAEVMAYETGAPPDLEKSTRAGSFALLIHSFIAIIAGTILPHLSERDHRLLRPHDHGPDGCHDEDGEDEEHDSEHERIRHMVQQWKSDAARNGKPLKLPTMPFMLRNIWTAALVLFFVLMMSTFAIVNVWQATVMISLVGICWAVACWVPFAMIMEFLKEIDISSPSSESPGARQGPTRTVSMGPGNNSHPSSPATERRPLLLRSYSTADLEAASADLSGQGPVAGGTIMGIHNLAIVVPQFIVAIVASIIFRLSEQPQQQTQPGAMSGGGGGMHGKNGVAWVLRFGGLMALVGAFICRKVPPTKTEKAMRRRLAEIRAEADECE